MRTAIITAAAMCALLLGVLSQAQARRADVVTIDGIINPAVAEFIAATITRSAAEGAECLMIRMDTPGGLDLSMRSIIKEMMGAGIPVIVYVSPAGARAASAGALITMAADIAAMAPGTNIGAAHPVSLGGGKIEDEMASKVENDAAAYAESIATKRNRNKEWAIKAVRESVSIAEKEALAIKVIDLIASDQIRMIHSGVCAARRNSGKQSNGAARSDTSPWVILPAREGGTRKPPTSRIADPAPAKIRRAQGSWTNTNQTPWMATCPPIIPRHAGYSASANARFGHRPDINRAVTPLPTKKDARQPKNSHTPRSEGLRKVRLLRRKKATGLRGGHGRQRPPHGKQDGHCTRADAVCSPAERSERPADSVTVRPSGAGRAKSCLVPMLQIPPKPPRISLLNQPAKSGRFLQNGRGGWTESPASPVVVRSVRNAEGEVRVADGVEIPYGEWLSVEFAVLDFSPEREHAYAYRLGDEWVELGARREITFTSLQPGTHDLRVRGRNSQGVWGESATPLRIVVVPPFWMTLPFRLLMLAAIVGLAMTWHWRRTSALERRNRELMDLYAQREKARQELDDAYQRLRRLTRRLEAAKEDERHRIARELHDEMGPSLTAVIINLQLLSTQRGTEQFARRVEDSVDLVDRLIQRIRDISLDLRPPLIDELGLAAALSGYLESVSERTGIRIDLSGDKDLGPLPAHVPMTAFRGC